MLMHGTSFFYHSLFHSLYIRTGNVWERMMILIHSWRIFPPQRIYRSQFGQDRWIVEHVFHRKRGGFFVEVGAADGIKNSNTVVLEKKYAWNGICIEPNDEFFKELKHNRSCACINACLYSHKDTVTFLDGAGQYGGILEDFDTADLKRIDRYVPSHRTHDAEGKVKTITKETCTLADVLDTSKAPAWIDYLSIDTEGSEFSILQNFPFDRYVFGAITVEHNRDEEKRRKLLNLLTSHNYVRAQTHIVDDFYVHESIYPLT